MTVIDNKDYFLSFTNVIERENYLSLVFRFLTITSNVIQRQNLTQIALWNDVCFRLFHVASIRFNNRARPRPGRPIHCHIAYHQNHPNIDQFHYHPKAISIITGTHRYRKNHVHSEEAYDETFMTVCFPDQPGSYGEVRNLGQHTGNYIECKYHVMFIVLLELQ